jgi:putative nucleotidyltransferase with HDIG domain
MIPAIDTCLELMERYNMLGNIKLHSIVVAKVAHLIARGLKNEGLDISIEKATAGALLHDIGKTISLETRDDHAKIGRDICMKHHFNEIANIVAEHVILKDYSIYGEYSEREVVYYGDKRVNHDRIVSLKEREIYILDRYGGNAEGLRRRIKDNFVLCKKVERKLFDKLDFDPGTLCGLAEKEDIGI